MVTIINHRGVRISAEYDVTIGVPAPHHVGAHDVQRAHVALARPGWSFVSGPDWIDNMDHRTALARHDILGALTAVTIFPNDAELLTQWLDALADAEIEDRA